MRKNQAILAALTVALLGLAFASCVAKGGTLFLVNESSYELRSARISLGDAREEKLYPGQSMKSSVDKNVSANVHFDAGDLTTHKGVDLVEVIGSNGGGFGPFGITFTSGLIKIHDGHAFIVTVRDKQQP